MGNSASTGFIIPTPKKLCRGCLKEDRIKLEDFLTLYEEDLWSVKEKKSFSVKKVHLTRSIRYAGRTIQDCDRPSPNMGEMLNPAFVGDQGP